MAHRNLRRHLRDAEVDNALASEPDKNVWDCERGGNDGDIKKMSGKRAWKHGIEIETDHNRRQDEAEVTTHVDPDFFGANSRISAAKEKGNDDKTIYPHGEMPYVHNVSEGDALFNFAGAPIMAANGDGNPSRHSEQGFAAINGVCLDDFNGSHLNVTACLNYSCTSKSAGQLFNMKGQNDPDGLSAGIAGTKSGAKSVNCPGTESIGVLEKIVNYVPPVSKAEQYTNGELKITSGVKQRIQPELRAMNEDDAVRFLNDLLRFKTPNNDDIDSYIRGQSQTATLDVMKECASCDLKKAIASIAVAGINVLLGRGFYSLNFGSFGTSGQTSTGGSGGGGGSGGSGGGGDGGGGGGGGNSGGGGNNPQTTNKFILPATVVSVTDAFKTKFVQLFDYLSSNNIVMLIITNLGIDPSWQTNFIATTGQIVSNFDALISSFEKYLNYIEFSGNSMTKPQQQNFENDIKQEILSLAPSASDRQISPLYEYLDHVQMPTIDFTKYPEYSKYKTLPTLLPYLNDKTRENRKFIDTRMIVQQNIFSIIDFINYALVVAKQPILLSALVTSISSFTSEIITHLQNVTKNLVQFVKIQCRLILETDFAIFKNRKNEAYNISIELQERLLSILFAQEKTLNQWSTITKIDIRRISRALELGLAITRTDIVQFNQSDYHSTELCPYPVNDIPRMVDDLDIDFGKQLSEKINTFCDEAVKYIATKCVAEYEIGKEYLDPAEDVRRYFEDVRAFFVDLHKIYVPIIEGRIFVPQPEWDKTLVQRLKEGFDKNEKSFSSATAAIEAKLSHLAKTSAIAIINLILNDVIYTRYKTKLGQLIRFFRHLLLFYHFRSHFPNPYDQIPYATFGHDNMILPLLFDINNEYFGFYTYMNTYIDIFVPSQLKTSLPPVARNPDSRFDTNYPDTATVEENDNAVSTIDKHFDDAIERISASFKINIHGIDLSVPFTITRFAQPLPKWIPKNQTSNLIGPPFPGRQQPQPRVNPRSPPFRLRHEPHTMPSLSDLISIPYSQIRFTSFFGESPKKKLANLRRNELYLARLFNLTGFEMDKEGVSDEILNDLTRSVFVGINTSYFQTHAPFLSTHDAGESMDTFMKKVGTNPKARFGSGATTSSHRELAKMHSNSMNKNYAALLDACCFHPRAIADKIVGKCLENVNAVRGGNNEHIKAVSTFVRGTVVVY